MSLPRVAILSTCKLRVVVAVGVVFLAPLVVVVARVVLTKTSSLLLLPRTRSPLVLVAQQERPVTTPPVWVGMVEILPSLAPMRPLLQ